MNETEISTKVKVFSDPEYCSAGDGMHCVYVEWDDDFCLLFREEILYWTDYKFRKCDACKEALKQDNKQKEIVDNLSGLCTGKVSYTNQKDIKEQGFVDISEDEK